MEILKCAAYIGYGVVGKSCHKAFEKGLASIVVDPLYSQNSIKTINDYKPAIVFVSINAPTTEDGLVDASVIYTIFGELMSIRYNGIVVLKSTLPPAIVYDLYAKFGQFAANPTGHALRYVYSPEFIRQAHWEYDAVHQPYIILSGSKRDCVEVEQLYKVYSEVDPAVQYHHMDYKTAALAKYAMNSFLATKVIFMNQLKELCKDINYGEPSHKDSWDSLTAVMSSDVRVGSSHMEVPGPDGEFGYGGACFPKDMVAMITFDRSNRLSLINEAAVANTKIRSL